MIHVVPMPVVSATVLVNDMFPFCPHKMAVLHEVNDALRSYIVPHFRSHTVPSFRFCAVPCFRSVPIARPSALFPIKATIAMCEERN